MTSHASLDKRLKDAQEMAVNFLSASSCLLTKEQIDMLEEKIMKSRLSFLASFGLPSSPKEEVLEGGVLPKLELPEVVILGEASGGSLDEVCHSYFSSSIFPDVIPAVQLVSEVVPEEAKVEEVKVPEKKKSLVRKDYNDYRWPSPRPKIFVERLLNLKKSRLTHGYCVEFLCKRLRLSEEDFKKLTPQEVSCRLWGLPDEGCRYDTNGVLRRWGRSWWGGRCVYGDGWY